MPPQNANQELLAIGPFGGIDLTTSIFYVKAPNFINMLNVVPNRQYVGYSSVQGRSNLFLNLPTAITQNNPTGYPAITLLSASDGWSIAAIWQFNGTFAPWFSQPQQVYIICYNCAGTGAIAENSIALAVWAPQTPAMPLTQIYGPSTPYSLAAFMYSAAPQNQFLFVGGIRTFQDGTSNNQPQTTAQPLKISTTNMVVSEWGIPAPTTAFGYAAPTVALAGAGTLSGQYNYCVTFSTAYQETSQGQISATITAANQQVALTAIPVSADAQVTGRNIYRIGGSLTQWQLVETINDNTTTSYTDNLADAAVIGQTLVYNRDVPPGFFTVFQHKERIWGFGYAAQPSDLWYSNYNEPWGFNNGATNPGVLFCGRNTNNDEGVAGCSIGSVAVLFKRKSTWAVYGDSPSDFLVRKLFDIGCIAPRSVCASYGVVFWLSRQGAYIFDGNTPTNISDGNPEQGSIKGFLSNPLYNNDIIQATGFVFDRIYYLSFPTLGYTFGYDIRSGTWHQLGWASSTCNVYSDPENAPYAVLAGRPGAPYAVDQWFAAETDLTTPITNYVTTGVSDSGAPQATKTYRYAYIEGPVQPGVTAEMQILIDPFDIVSGATNGRTQSFTQTVDMSQGPTRHWFSLPALVGNSIQVQLSATLNATATPANINLWRAGVLGTIKRLNSPEGDT
jgi:hypothetical protein